MSQTDGPYYGGGGGYVPSGSPFGGSANDSPGLRNRTDASNALRPVTIIQIKKATQMHADADWMLDDIELSQVTTVAQVVETRMQATNCVYVLDDGTGRLEARHWIDSQNARAEGLTDEPLELKYIRVNGTIKIFGTKRYINATHIRPCQDPHELYFHLLEAIMVTLIHEKGAPSFKGQGHSDSHGMAMTGITSTSAYSAQSGNATLSNEHAHLPPLQQRILRFMLSQPFSDEGIHVAAIARHIGPGTQAEEIDSALEKLGDDGHVFTGTDESHYLVSR